MRTCWCRRVIALIALVCLVNGRVVEKSNHEKEDEFILGPDLVDYSGIEDVDRLYTLHKLVNGEISPIDYDEDTTMEATTEPQLEVIVTTTTSPEEEKEDEEEKRFDNSEDDDDQGMESEIEEHYANHYNFTHNAGRILGVTAADAGQFPYYAYIVATLTTGTVDCGGALLSDTWVVTSAQCVATASNINVIAGIIDSTVTTPLSKGIATVHPGYRRNFLIHDIALVRLLSPFTLSSLIYPIKLPKHDKTTGLDNVSVRTVGFGSASNTKTKVTPLNYVDLVRISKANCNRQTSEIFVTYPGNAACMSTSNSLKGFCYGDTGGPVVYTYPSDLAPTLLGVNSQYQECPSAYPMSYTRVAPYLGWIKTYVKKLLT